MARAPYFEPFDDIYRDVTVRIKSYAATLPDKKEGDWLCTIVEAFKNESDQWDAGGNIHLREFCHQVAKLKLALLQLTAGAFMHIAYDLPRVIVANWPGEGRWSPEPDEFSAESRYKALRPVFGDVLMESARVSKRVGLLSWPLPGKNMALGAAAHWIGELRLAAWSNAKLVHAQKPGLREETYTAMLVAVCAALKDSSTWQPWAFIDLHTPLVGVRSGTASILSLTPLTIFSHDQLPITDAILSLIGIGGVALLGGIYWLRRRQTLSVARDLLEAQVQKVAILGDEAEQARRYICELGLRTRDYVNAAVEMSISVE